MTSPATSHPNQATALRKVRLLLWKNFLLQKRHKIHTIVDVFLPVLFFLLCAWFNGKTKTEMYPQKSYINLSIDSLKPIDLSIDSLGLSSLNGLIFTPNNDHYKHLMETVSKNLHFDNLPVGVNSSDQLETTLVKNKLTAGIEFHHPIDANDLPKSLSYSLRFPSELRYISLNLFSDDWKTNDWKTNRRFPKNAFSPYSPKESYGGQPSYYKEGFLAIQNAIAKAFIEHFNNGSNKTPNIFVNRFPSPSYSYKKVDPTDFAAFFLGNFAIIFLMSMTYSFMNTVRFITMEKEKQLKEVMKIMGLAGWMHYLSWFIRTMIMLSIPMILITLLLTTPWFGASKAIFPNTNFLCLVIFFIGYCICMITFGFVICAIFTKTKSAMIGSNIFSTISMVSCYIFDGKYNELTGWFKLLSCICPNIALGFGFKIIGQLEQIELGLNWHTVFETASVYDNLSVAKIFGIFMLTSISMFFLAVYLENVLPGGYGVTKPWYFLFTRDFWRNLNCCQQVENQSNEDFELHEFPQTNTNKSNFEKEPTNKTIGIQIRNLTKKFKSDKAAVSNLSFNIYNDQITCLLGQNGAGKTTAISMLIGMMEPTSGTAFINGFNIRTNMDMARNSMSFCPQHNILFDELTVREHILFYCHLKGLSNEATEREIGKYGRILELTDKMDTLSTALSGGMKRKLSVVIALCGGSKVVFLDEPTSGMDPDARRALWNILLAEKKDRTILLTTHFMDEADVLSDRIAILADGELKCSGSTFFLKRRFGSGYHLICAKDTDCNSRVVTDLLRTHIEDIHLEHENVTEISYLLPEEKTHIFTKIFEDLETNESRLNLRSFGVSFTTLEEIFLNLGKLDKIDAIQSQSLQSADSNSVISDTQITLNDDQIILRGVRLWCNQAIAMFKKRFHCWIGSWKSFLCYNLIVVVMLSILIIALGNIFSESNKLPALEITFDEYKSPYAIMPSNASVSNNIAAKYKKNIENSSAKYLPVDNDDMKEGLLNLAHQSIRPFIFQYLTGVSFPTNETIIAWFNGQAYHSSALALNLVHNAIAKTFLGDEFEIHVTNEPLNFLPKNEINADFIPSLFGISFSIIIGMSMSFLSAWYITFYINEKERNSKFLQYASGAYSSIFWGSSILWDLLTNTITICIIIIMLIIGQYEHWKSPSELAIVFLILFVYNFAMIPIVCIASLLFSKPATGMNVMNLANSLIFILFFLNKMKPFFYQFVEYIFWAYPICTMADAMSKLQPQKLDSIFNLLKASNSAADQIFSWGDAGISKNLMFMIATGICAYIVLLLIEGDAFKFTRTMMMRLIPRTYPENDSINVDDDVLAEKQRIDIMNKSELSKETLIMQKVSKFYGQFCAVNQISIAMKRGECFGLLGKNGAGKSSIFKMLTGETEITNGQIFTQGYNQHTELSDIYQIIGYCPQFDALQNELTCRETLEIYALLRGIPFRNVRHYIENCARRLDFFQHIDKKVDELSGGNKRKLSTSLALIGKLSVIFLDEPSTGLDPTTKRNLWNVVIQSREAGKSIVLTTHNIEECEALCTRMTVLVNGLCKCLGSAQHLKNKFTKGFELKIKVKNAETIDNDIIAAKNFVLEKFTGAIFIDEYQGILTYSVPTENIKWSQVFSIMENAENSLNIEDYSVSQRGLEQVVLTLFKDQEKRRNQE